MKIVLIVSIYVVIFHLKSPVFAQDSRLSNNKDTLVQLASDNLHNHYLNFIKRQSELYSGRQFIGYKEVIKGHQFLFSKLWQPADIVYDNFLYKDVDSRFDIYNQELVIKHFDESGSMESIVPDQMKIKSFTIYDKYFLNMDLIDTLVNSSKLGYLQVVYNGEMIVLSKKVKKALSGVNKEFNEKERYFIVKNNILYKVNNKRAFLKLVPQYKKPLKKFVRNRKLYFNENPSYFLQQMSKQYELLKANE